MDSLITFEGPGPFHLPAAQRATADANSGNGVTAIFQCQLPNRQRDHTEAVNIQMLSSVARELAVRLLQAADEADRPRP